MQTIRQRLTFWYTVALGVTVAAFGTLLYLERRESSLQELDQRLGLEADLANRWLSESYSVLGRIVTTARARRSTASAPTSGGRDAVVVVDTTGACSPCPGGARAQPTRSSYSRPGRLARVPKRAGTMSLGGRIGSSAGSRSVWAADRRSAAFSSRRR